MGKLTAVLCAIALSGAAAALAGDIPAARVPAATDSAAAPAQALSAEVQAAIGQLSADDYQAREDALRKLQLALGRQMQALVASDDPEVQARLTALLEFNDGLTRWILDTFKLPNEQRKATIEFGLSPQVLPVLALVFSSESAKRVEGVHKLAKFDGPEATMMLGRLLGDSDRAVYVAAMDAVYDRKPDDVIVDALWGRAVEAGLSNANGPQLIANPKVVFQKRVLPPGNVYDYSNTQRGQDAGIACEVLLHLKPPQLHEKLKGFLEAYQKVVEGKVPNGNIWMYNGTESGRNAFRLIEEYKSRELVPLLYKIANAKVMQSSQQQVGNEKISWSNRTTALATLITVVGLNPADYDLKRSTIMGGTWTEPTPADEDATVKKVQAWWAANGEKYTDKTAAKESDAAATQPAAGKADEAPAGANVPPQVEVHQIIQGKLIPGGGGVIHIQVGPDPAPDK